MQVLLNYAHSLHGPLVMMPLEVGGKASPLLEERILSFQRNSGCVADGHVDVGHKTWKSLLEARLLALKKNGDEASTKCFQRSAFFWDSAQEGRLGDGRSVCRL